MSSNQNIPNMVHGFKNVSPDVVTTPISPNKIPVTNTVAHNIPKSVGKQFVPPNRTAPIRSDIRPDRPSRPENIQHVPQASHMPQVPQVPHGRQPTAHYGNRGDPQFASQQVLSHRGRGNTNSSSINNYIRDKHVNNNPITRPNERDIDNVDAGVTNPANTMVIFGQTIQKKYVYILGAILLLVVSYYAWKWYTNKKSKEDDDEDDDEDNEQEDEREYSTRYQGRPPLNYRHYDPYGYGPNGHNGQYPPQYDGGQYGARQPMQAVQSAQPPPQSGQAGHIPQGQPVPNYAQGNPNNTRSQDIPPYVSRQDKENNQRQGGQQNPQKMRGHDERNTDQSELNEAQFDERIEQFTAE